MSSYAACPQVVLHIPMGEVFMTEEYTFNMPDKKFREVEGTEMRTFGPEGKAADVQGYESDDGPSIGDEADEGRLGRHTLLLYKKNLPIHRRVVSS